MIRVYLDWNVIIGLRDASREPFISLKQKLSQYKDLLIVPYSPAHVDDLGRRYDGTDEKLKLIRDDLKVLSETTKDVCFYQPWKKPDAAMQIRNPEQWFNDNYLQEKESIEELLDFSEYKDDPEMMAKYAEMEAQFNAIPVLTEEQLATLPKEIRMFTRLPGQTYADFLKQVGVGMDDFMVNPETYKDLREMTVNGFSLNRSEISGSDNPIEKLNEVLSASPIGKNFNEHVEDNNKTKVTDNEWYDKVSRYYTNSDIFGVNPEAINKKNTFDNFISDSQHAFFGSLCHVLVTNDKKARLKIKAVYKFFEIPTKVITAEELLLNLDSMVSDMNSKSAFFASLKEAVGDIKNPANILSSEKKEDGSKCKIFKLSKNVMNFFSIGTFDVDDNGRTLLGFHRTFTPRNPFVMYNEIEYLTNKLLEFNAKELGDRGTYSKEIDEVEINKGKWKGRQWLMDDTLISLDFGTETGFRLMIFSNFKS